MLLPPPPPPPPGVRVTRRVLLLLRQQPSLPLLLQMLPMLCQLLLLLLQLGDGSGGTRWRKMPGRPAPRGRRTQCEPCRHAIRSRGLPPPTASGRPCIRQGRRRRPPWRPPWRAGFRSIFDALSTNAGASRMGHNHRLHKVRTTGSRAERCIETAAACNAFDAAAAASWN